MTERRIVEYKMLRVSGNAMTTEALNKEIADGFQPYGSKIHIETGSDFFHFYMPMVRYAEPEPTPDDEQDAEIERLRAEVAQLKAERDYANEHFGYLTQSVDHLFTTFATTEHSDDPADAIKAVSRALYEFRKRAKRAGISMTTSAALADQTGGEG